MSLGTEESMWLVINLRVMSWHAKKLLQEMLRHELGVPATPGMLTQVSKRQQESELLLCAYQEITALTRAISAQSSHSLFHGSWLVHPHL